MADINEVFQGVFRDISDINRRVDRLEAAEYGMAVGNWTPVVTQSTAVNKTINFAKYMKVGHIVFAAASLTMTSSGTAGQAIYITGLSTALWPKTLGVGTVIGVGNFLDSGTAYYPGSLVAPSTLGWGVYCYNQGNLMGIAPSFAIASGDIMGIMAMYEVATTS